ncbi:hypothetical protein RT99_05955 [Flavobacterium sp. MEB061]|uniref:hypothetical protein n=1 Tax=Flavobacterium sp. MEB061 TaxID=1587524 RepID=UPI0005ABF248|nr:hypothetical protein [Flavobacterium sp. MEB061]KIQ22650.1 hypothetical protein RT99_05955 [Flavobacterium sp. MEB061]
MLDYLETVREFFIDNFTPSNPESANVKLSTRDLLVFIFRTFPANCISDYELNEILISLSYKRYTYVIESYAEVEKDDRTVYEIRKSLDFGWCLKSDLDLMTQEVEML